MESYPIKPGFPWKTCTLNNVVHVCGCWWYNQSIWLRQERQPGWVSQSLCPHTQTSMIIFVTVNWKKPWDCGVHLQYFKDAGSQILTPKLSRPFSCSSTAAYKNTTQLSHSWICLYQLILRNCASSAAVLKCLVFQQQGKINLRALLLSKEVLEYTPLTSQWYNWISKVN